MIVFLVLDFLVRFIWLVAFIISLISVGTLKSINLWVYQDNSQFLYFYLKFSLLISDFLPKHFIIKWSVSRTDKFFVSHWDFPTIFFTSFLANLVFLFPLFLFSIKGFWILIIVNLYPFVSLWFVLFDFIDLLLFVFIPKYLRLEILFLFNRSESILIIFVSVTTLRL